MASKGSIISTLHGVSTQHHSQISVFSSNARPTDTDREMVEGGDDMETMYLFPTDYKYGTAKNELVRRTTKSGVWNRMVE